MCHVECVYVKPNIEVSAVYCSSLHDRRVGELHMAHCKIIVAMCCVRQLGHLRTFTRTQQKQDGYHHVSCRLHQTTYVCFLF